MNSSDEMGVREPSFCIDTILGISPSWEFHLTSKDNAENAGVSASVP